MKKITIKMRPYNYTCADDCSYESGYEFFIDGQHVCYAPNLESALTALFAEIGIDAELEYDC